MSASYSAEVHVLTLHLRRMLSMVGTHGWVKLVTSLPGFMKTQTLCKRSGETLKYGPTHIKTQWTYL